MKAPGMPVFAEGLKVRAAQLHNDIKIPPDDDLRRFWWDFLVGSCCADRDEPAELSHFPGVSQRIEKQKSHDTRRRSDGISQDFSWSW